MDTDEFPPEILNALLEKHAQGAQARLILQQLEWLEGDLERLEQRTRQSDVQIVRAVSEPQTSENYTQFLLLDDDQPTPSEYSRTITAKGNIRIVENGIVRYQCQYCDCGSYMTSQAIGGHVQRKHPKPQPIVD